MIVVNALRETVSFINRPGVKSGIKNLSGVITFSAGTIELYDLFRMMRRQEKESNLTLGRVALLAGRFSLVVSALLTYPGQWITSNTVGQLVSPNLFGPNVIFATNPYHPRHLASFAAFGLTLSTAVLSPFCCNGDKSDGVILSDRMVVLLLLFNLVTSRPFLHLGNQVAHTVLWKH